MVNNDWSMERVDIPATTRVFTQAHVAYLKEISTITVSGPAKAILTDRSDVLMAVAKGVVFAVTDSWLYNEYIDHRNNLPPEFDTYSAAKDLARWAIKQPK